MTVTEMGDAIPLAKRSSGEHAIRLLVGEAERKLPPGSVYEIRTDEPLHRALAWYWSPMLDQEPLFVKAVASPAMMNGYGVVMRARTPEKAA